MSLREGDSMMEFLCAVRADRRGVSHIEYAFLAFFMIGVVLLVAETIGTTLGVGFGIRDAQSACAVARVADAYKVGRDTQRNFAPHGALHRAQVQLRSIGLTDAGAS